MGEGNLPNQLLVTPALQRQLREITVWTTAEQFGALDRVISVAAPPPVDTNYLLTCASILALSDSASCQDAALRIVTFVFVLPTSTSIQRDAAAVILDELTNTPALQLAERRGLVEQHAFQRVPLPLRLDALQRAARYSELDAIDGETIYRVNRFQKQVYEAYRDAQWVSISAPTSAGKTHAVMNLTREFIAPRPACVVVFIVPTRALIQQVEGDLRAVVGRIPGVLISSVPQLPAEWRERRMVFVFTQERLHLLMNDAPPDFAPDIVIVDEAQKIGDGARGVLLQDVLDGVVRRAPNVRVLFASPMTSNPEILLDAAPSNGAAVTVMSERIAVNQNLLWVSQSGIDTRRWDISQCIGEVNVLLGSVGLANRPTSEGKRLPMLAHALAGASGGSLVYVDGAAVAEKTALLLRDLQPANEPIDVEVQTLIDLARTVVHQKYVLAHTLERRVAFHYGNMPLIIRAEIERLFKDGKIRFLVCTSTLVEGVNLPAQSIFVRGPKKGRNTPMNEMDFWNLAGRAGRLGREFQGNVVCVDPHEERVWGKTPPRTRRRYPIVKTLDEIVLRRSDELLKFIGDGTPVTLPARDSLEQTFVYFYAEFRRRGTLQGSPVSAKYPTAFITQLNDACVLISEAVELPDDIIFRNPGVSPVSQQRLLSYFRTKKNLDELMPALPEDTKAAERYVKVIGRISTHLSGDPQPLNWPHAILVVSWMRGYPLARLITEAVEYWMKKAKKPKSLPNVIRDTMRDVEEFARFRFAKYSSCYVDILRYHLTQIGQADRAAEIPRLSIWLEFGASQGTQIALMGLGLSRTTAIQLSEIIAADDLDLQEAMAWLSAADLDSFDLSPVMLSEIARVRQPAA